jgi:hypothetical protein
MPWLPDPDAAGGWFAVGLMAVCAVMLVAEVLR